LASNEIPTLPQASRDTPSYRGSFSQKNPRPRRELPPLARSFGSRDIREMPPLARSFGFRDITKS
jgi:hypothetical protein